MVNVAAIHKENENALKVNRTRAKQRGIQKSKEVEEASDKAKSDDSEETESDGEAARKETQDVSQNTLSGNENLRSGSELIAEETPLREKEADKAIKEELERHLPFGAVQPVPSHDVEKSASSVSTSLPTTPYRDKRSNEAYLEGNASMTGETTAVPQPKRRKTTAGKSVPDSTSPASMPATGEDVEGVATAVIDEPVTTLLRLQPEPIKETTPFVESDVVQLQETGGKAEEYSAFWPQEGDCMLRMGMKPDSSTSRDEQRKSTQELTITISHPVANQKLTELGTAKYPQIQNEYGITLADVINLRGNSRDKGAYEAYKTVIELCQICMSKDFCRGFWLSETL